MFGVLTALGAPSLTNLSLGIVIKLSQKKNPPPPEVQQQVAAAVAQARAAQPPRSRPKLPDVDPLLLPKREVFAYDDIGDALEAFGKGQMLVLVSEDEAMEEGETGAVEGILVVSADEVWAEQLAWMIKWTSGFITIAVPQETLEDLEISMMSDAVMNFERRGKGKGKGKGKVRTPEKKKNEGEPEYAVGVDYKHGTTTGISARDRALTARALASPDTEPSDFIRPGHLVPVLARPISASSSTEKNRRRPPKPKRSPAPPPPHLSHSFASASVTLCDMTGHEAAALMATLVHGNEDDKTFERKEGDQSQEDEEVRAERELKRERNKKGGLMTKEDCRAFADKWGLKMISVGLVKKEWEERKKREKEKSKGKGKQTYE